MKLIETVTLAPLILPHVVFAVRFYPGFVIAHSLVSVSNVVITVTAALRRVDPMLEIAALDCGASRTRAFLFVVLPDIAPSVAAGVRVSRLLRRGDSRVLHLRPRGQNDHARKLFEHIDYNLTPVIAAASTIMMLLAFVLTGSVEWLRHRLSRQ